MPGSRDRHDRLFVPAGWPIVTPRRFCRDPKGLVASIMRVFRATGTHRDDRPSELRIGDSIIMVNDDSARGPATAFLDVYVDDTDAAYRRAVAAGARPIETPGDQLYGDRRAMVEDAWGQYLADCHSDHARDSIAPAISCWCSSNE